MHQRKYFTLNFFINEIFSVEKFPNYGIYKLFYFTCNHIACVIITTRSRAINPELHGYDSLQHSKLQ